MVRPATSLADRGGAGRVRAEEPSPSGPGVFGDGGPRDVVGDRSTGAVATPSPWSVPLSSSTPSRPARRPRRPRRSGRRWREPELDDRDVVLELVPAADGAGLRDQSVQVRTTLRGAAACEGDELLVGPHRAVGPGDLVEPVAVEEQLAEVLHGAARGLVLQVGERADHRSLRGE